MPHCLVPEGQGTPQQDGMPGSDHPIYMSQWAGYPPLPTFRRLMVSYTCAWIPRTSTRPSAEIITRCQLWRKLLTSLHTLTSLPSWMPTMDTSQSFLTRTPACLQLLTVLSEDTVSCDFHLALSVPKTS